MARINANDRINAQDNRGSRKSHNKVLIGASLSVVVMVAIISLYLSSQAKNNVTDYNAVITEDNVEDIVANLDETEITPTGSYEVKMNMDWEFPDGNSASTNAYVENSVYNQNTVYFTIELNSNPGVEIFKSPYIPVGSHMENIKLTNPLEAGKHDAVLTYHLVDEDMEELSSVSVALTLTVEK